MKHVTFNCGNTTTLIVNCAHSALEKKTKPIMLNLDQTISKIVPLAETKASVHGNDPKEAESSRTL